MRPGSRNRVRARLVELGEDALVAREGRAPAFRIPYREILTAERLRSRRGLDLHVQGMIEPVRVRCRRAECETIESGLRFMGVRIVDCWGAIIAPTVLDFEEELAREPVRVGQSSDDA